MFTKIFNWLTWEILRVSPERFWEFHLRNFESFTWEILRVSPERFWEFHLRDFESFTWEILRVSPEKFWEFHLRNFESFTWEILRVSPERFWEFHLRDFESFTWEIFTWDLLKWKNTVYVSSAIFTLIQTLFGTYYLNLPERILTWGLHLKVHMVDLICDMCFVWSWCIAWTAGPRENVSSWYSLGITCWCDLPLSWCAFMRVFLWLAIHALRFQVTFCKFLCGGKDFVHWFAVIFVQKNIQNYMENHRCESFMQVWWKFSWNFHLAMWKFHLGMWNFHYQLWKFHYASLKVSLLIRKFHMILESFSQPYESFKFGSETFQLDSETFKYVYWNFHIPMWNFHMPKWKFHENFHKTFTKLSHLWFFDVLFHQSSTKKNNIWWWKTHQFLWFVHSNFGPWVDFLPLFGYIKWFLLFVALRYIWPQGKRT